MRSPGPVSFEGWSMIDEGGRRSCAGQKPGILAFHRPIHSGATPEMETVWREDKSADSRIFGEKGKRVAWPQNLPQIIYFIVIQSLLWPDFLGLG